jgi:hypothetical protein
MIGSVLAGVVFVVAMIIAARSRGVDRDVSRDDDCNVGRE